MENSNTVIVIEHNIVIIKHTDWIINLGPERGNKGGKIIAKGTPEQIVKVKNSYTGKYLNHWLIETKMTITEISKLNPRVWGVTIHFNVLEKGEVRNVNFKDGSEHRVSEDLVGDNSGTILLNLWDDHIELIKKGKCYELTEARLTVFNNIMKLTMSRKSEIKTIKEDINVDMENNMSEKSFKPAKKFSYRRNDR